MSLPVKLSKKVALIICVLLTLLVPIYDFSVALWNVFLCADGKIGVTFYDLFDTFARGHCKTNIALFRPCSSTAGKDATRRCVPSTVGASLRAPFVTKKTNYFFWRHVSGYRNSFSGISVQKYVDSSWFKYPEALLAIAGWATLYPATLYPDTHYPATH